MSGFESDEYMNEPDNHAAYDVNTIANYDPDIVPFLDAPAGSAFERKNGTGPFAESTTSNRRRISGMSLQGRLDRRP